jgi:hypothetical protein
MYKIIERKTETKSIGEVKLNRIYLFIQKDYFEPERIKDDKYTDWFIIQNNLAIFIDYYFIDKDRTTSIFKNYIKTCLELYDIFECESFLEAFNYIKEGK